MSHAMVRQLIFVVIFILILAVGGYYLYQNSSLSSTPAPTDTAGGSDDVEARLADLRRLKDLKLDTSILQNRFFLSLQSLRTASTSDVRTGRQNPFIP